MVIIKSKTSHRANVIMARTGSAAIGVVKAQMIDLPQDRRDNNRDIGNNRIEFDACNAKRQMSVSQYGQCHKVLGH